MTIRRREDGVVELTGKCESVDAEVLLGYLLADRGASIDWRDCDTAHTAVVQVILAAGVAPLGPPRGQFLNDVVGPLLSGASRMAGRRAD